MMRLSKLKLIKMQIKIPRSHSLELKQSVQVFKKCNLFTTECLVHNEDRKMKIQGESLCSSTVGSQIRTALSQSQSTHRVPATAKPCKSLITSPSAALVLFGTSRYNFSKTLGIDLASPACMYTQ